MSPGDSERDEAGWDELDRALAAAAGPVAPPAEHPSLDELVSYQVRELDAAARERLEDHLVACPACARAVRETARHRAPEAELEPAAPSAAEVDAAWRRFQERQAGAAPAIVHRLAAPERARRRPVAWRLLPLAATFLVALGLGYLLGDRRPPEPLANAALVELLPGAEGATRGDDAPVVDPAGAGALHVLLASAVATPGELYDVTVRDAAERRVAGVAGLRAGTDGRLSFVLRERPAPGSYVVELRPAAAGTGAAAIETFPLALPTP